jgi:hypothetical protein
VNAWSLLEMMKMRNGFLAMMVAFTLGGAGFGCGSSSTPNTPPVGGTGGGTGGSVGATGGTGGSSGDAAAPDGSSSTPDTGAAPDGTTGGSDGGAGGCFSGAPTTNEQFLNACPAMGAFFKDKAVTLPGGVKVGGTLPPLQ